MSTLRLLIDGYNLMFQVLSLDPKLGKQALQRARQRFLSEWIEQIDAPMRTSTLIVFDASEAPKGLPDSMVQRGVRIQFARDWASADEWIQAEIRKHSAPKLLTVVSSDHAIQKTARSRGARAIDCQDWLDELADAFADRARNQKELSREVKPLTSSHDMKNQVLNPDETREWLREFGE
jgi:uncharacterized protein